MREISYHYIVEPTQVTPPSGSSITRVQHPIFKQKNKSYVKIVEDHEDNMAEIFKVIHGQCTKEFVNQMHTFPEYKLANDESNVISLIEII